MTTKYREIVKDLESRKNNKSDPTLEKTRNALKELGNPQNSYKTVLVGGTNGKGSTVEMISEGLQSKEFRVGTFTSPHLVSCRERTRVNQKKISKDCFVKLFKEIERVSPGLSFFEFTTVLSYLYFDRKNVDYAVVEVGMGGRLDATNAVDNKYAVITNIGKDHSAYLGETREEIAREKAGIIPKNGKLVTRENYSSIIKLAEDRNTEIVKPVKIEQKGSEYYYDEKKFTIPLEGGFQKENLETAVKTIEMLEEKIEKPSEAFGNLYWPGRMEKISENPLYIQDGAHNPDALKKVIPDYPEDFVCVFNAVKSKNTRKMIEIIESKSSKLYLTRSTVFNAEKPEKIAEHASIPFEVIESPSEAVKKAKNDGKPVVVTGSLYLLGDLKKTSK